MEIRNKDILGCFPLLASVLGDKYGVEIRIGGDKAMTDGRTIYIPAMPADLDDETLQAAKGYVDHESAHIRYTDFEAMRSANLARLEQWLFNAIEDWRVEHRLAELFPGCGHNFRTLIIKLFGETTGAGSKNPALVVLDYVLLSVRSWAVPEVAGRKKQAGQMVDENFPGLKLELDRLLMEIPKNCHATTDAIIYARQLGACIRKYVSAPESREKKGELPNQMEPEGQSGAAPADGGNRSHKPEPDNVNSKNEAGPCSRQTQTDEQEDKSPQNSEDNPEIQTNPENSGFRELDIDSLLVNGSRELPQNLGSLLSARLEARTADKGSGVVMAAVSGKKTAIFPAGKKAEAMSGSVALRQRLAGLLQARTIRQCGTGRNGKPDSSGLHRICVGNARVFGREAERIALDAAVHVLLDCSASMKGTAMSITGKSCYALVKALAHANGINLAVTAFPAEHARISVFPAIRHGQRVKEMPFLDAFGDTPLGPALWWVMREMLPLRESRKIILILTDGVPNSIKAARVAIAQCQKLKIEVMGIGIQSSAIRHLLPKSSKVIGQLNELAPAMFELMRDTLLNGGRK